MLLSFFDSLVLVVITSYSFVTSLDHNKVEQILEVVFHPLEEAFHLLEEVHHPLKKAVTFHMVVDILP
jgi:hypothetical protein